MVDLDGLFNELEDYIAELATKFVVKYIPADPNAPPSDYSHDVKAYCVLAHAAFEEFIESTVLAIVDNSVERWVLDKRTDNVIIALVCWFGSKLKIDANVNSRETKPFDYLRKMIVEAKAAFSNFVVMQNHGVSKIYLRNLLIPVSIEVTDDANLLNSLQQLAKGRGDYAHKGRSKAVLPPEDAKRYVEDVLVLCGDVRAKALSKVA